MSVFPQSLDAASPSIHQSFSTSSSSIGHQGGIINRSKEPCGLPPSYGFNKNPLAIMSKKNEPSGPPPAATSAREPSGPPPNVKSTSFSMMTTPFTFASPASGFTSPFSSSALPPPLTAAFTPSPASLESPVGQWQVTTPPVVVGMKRPREEEEEDQVEEEYKFQPPIFAATEEQDEHRLEQRRKQIDLGKNTVGYQNYTENVPRQARQRFNKIHPVTPNIKDQVSKRQFDGLVKAWRRQLHVWDVLPGQSAAHRVAIPTRTVKKQRMVVEKEEQNTNPMQVEEINKVERSIFDDFEDL